MNIQRDQITSILGVDVRTKHKKDVESFDKNPSNLIIHKQIQGDEVYVPFNMGKIWPNHR